MMCTETGVRNDCSLFITAWEPGGRKQSYPVKGLKESEKNCFFINVWPNLELIATGHKSVI